MDTILSSAKFSIMLINFSSRALLFSSWQILAEATQIKLPWLRGPIAAVAADNKKSKTV